MHALLLNTEILSAMHDYAKPIRYAIKPGITSSRGLGLYELKGYNRQNPGHGKALPQKFGGGASERALKESVCLVDPLPPSTEIVL